jgi:hypothetical protein
MGKAAPQPIPNKHPYEAIGSRHRRPAGRCECYLLVRYNAGGRSASRQTGRPARNIHVVTADAAQEGAVVVAVRLSARRSVLDGGHGSCGRWSDGKARTSAQLSTLGNVGHGVMQRLGQCNAFKNCQFHHYTVVLSHVQELCHPYEPQKWKMHAYACQLIFSYHNG